MSGMSYAERRLRNARAHVVQSHPFFGTLLLRQRVVETDRVEAMATDGDNLYFNPRWVTDCPLEELHGVCAHEALHPALCHHARRGDREPRLWNEATDYAINPVLLAAGFRLPRGALVRDDLTALGQAEKIYARLAEERRQARPDAPGEGGGGGAGDEGGSPSPSSLGSAGSPTPSVGGCGAVLDAPARTEEELREHDVKWRLAAAQASVVARAAGNVPAGLEAALADVLEPRASVREQLRRFMAPIAREDYSWRAPNRRFIADGLYLPSARSEALPPACLVLDTSGSVPDRLLAEALGEMRAIFEELRPAWIDVVQHDAAITSVRRFEVGEDLDVEVVGRGGTLFAPVCDHVNDAAEPYSVVVWFTDLLAADWGEATRREPLCPVLWVDYSDGKVEPRFGDEVVRVPR